MIKYGESPVLIIGGEITSEQSLKHIYTQLDFDYAHIECDSNSRIKPKGILNVKEEMKKNNLFYYDFDIDFCPNNDPKKFSCIKDKDELAKQIKVDILCKVFFGGMTKPKTLISNNFNLIKQNIISAKQFIP